MSLGPEQSKLRPRFKIEAAPPQDAPSREQTGRDGPLLPERALLCIRPSQEGEVCPVALW